jgi:hypothetical protein
MSFAWFDSPPIGDDPVSEHTYFEISMGAVRLQMLHVHIMTKAANSCYSLD